MIKLFGAEWCPACKQAKIFLEKNNIGFQYVEADSDYGKEELQKLGFRSIPVLDTGENKVVGFTESSYEIALDL